MRRRPPYHLCVPGHLQLQSLLAHELPAVRLHRDQKILDWLVDYPLDPVAFQAGMRRVVTEHPTAPYFHFIAWQGFYRRDPSGETCLDKMAKAGFPGLTADERIVARARMRMRPALVEIHRVLNSESVEAVDLLNPLDVPFVVVDRVLSATAVRFSTYLLHLVPLPNFHRPFGTCCEICSQSPFSAEELAPEVIRFHGGVTGADEIRRWLEENSGKFCDAIEAVVLARSRAMFENLDGLFGKAVYELTKPFSEYQAHLDSLREIFPEPPTNSERREGFGQARVWSARAGDPEIDYIGEGAVLGRVLLGPTHWRLEAMGAAKIDKLRARFENLMGDAVRFAGERRDDLTKSILEKQPSYDPALVPPALLADPPQLMTGTARVPDQGGVSSEASVQQYLEAQERRFLDEPVPALEDKTPRRAAADPELRPDLIMLMKERIYDADRKNRETGSADDLNWMLRELGLNEILFPPPPPRPPRKPASKPTQEDDLLWDDLDEQDL